MRNSVFFELPVQHPILFLYRDLNAAILALAICGHVRVIGCSIATPVHHLFKNSEKDRRLHFHAYLEMTLQ